MNIVLCTFVIQLSYKVVDRKSSSVLGNYLLIIFLEIEE